jgi:hypothetical protein
VTRIRAAVLVIAVAALTQAAGLASAPAADAEDVHWQRTYNGRQSGRDALTSVVAAGGAFLVGWCRASRAGADAVILRLAP